MKLYHSNASPNSRRVRIFLREKGISMPLLPVDLGAREQFSDAFRAINPRLQVPVLVLDDGTAIAEVPAIWRYLEDTHPAQPLLGATPKERARVLMWERRMELDGFAAVMEAVRNRVAGLKGRALSGPHDYEQIPALVERSTQRVHNFFADLNARLAETAFVAGDSFSAADITALAAVDFAKGGMELAVPAEHAALLRWYQVVSSRPGVNERN